jgi:DNA (cytosine-5)-methyltransferase 1
MTASVPMQIGSLFSGAGGLDLAAEMVFGGRVVWQAEIDPAAAKVLAHRFPGIPNLGDITKVDWSTVDQVDVLCGGFPCFPAGTLIDAGEDGLRPIETLRVGDMVLTHERRRRAVTSVMRRQADDVLVLKAMGAPEFQATAEHPFYVRRKDVAGLWGAPQWVEAGQLVKGDMLAMPIDEAGTQPVLGEALAYVVGRWLGDGWIVDHKRTSKTPQGHRGSRVTSRVHKAIICAAPSEAPELAAAITAAGLHATTAPERTVVKFHISSQDLVKKLRDFGRGAAGKRLPGWVFTAPQEERAALLLGWLHADGYRQSTGSWKATTVSGELAHGMARLARDVHGVATSVHYADQGPTSVIEGRTVNVRPQYQVVIPTRNKASFVEGGFAWVPLRSVREGEPCEVFNVSVDEDESYTAWGYTVHNCQDVSTAGRRAGLHDGTRSGLWAMFAGAIEALRPRFVVIENVRGLVSATAHRLGEDDEDAGGVEPGEAVVGGGAGRPVLRAAGAVLGDLADLGYDAQWSTVSAASIGAPHKRERVFIVAVDAHSDYATGHREWSCSEPRQGSEAVADAESVGRAERWPESAWQQGRSDVAVGGSSDAVTELLPTPCASRSGSNQSLSPGAAVRPSLDGITELLPTPSAADGGGGHLTRSGDRSNELLLPGVARAYGTGDLLPTPNASDGTGGGQHPDRREGHSRQLIDYALLNGTAQWSKYAPAIARWEELTRPAPSPTEPNRNGKPRLNAAFPEWMMGWPAGWVTDVPGVSRNDALRIVGNGVCPQQAAYALRWLLSAFRTAS